MVSFCISLVPIVFFQYAPNIFGWIDPLGLVKKQECPNPRHVEWAGDMRQINKTMAELGWRALRESGGSANTSEAILRKYGEMMNKRFTNVGSSKRAEREAGAYNNSAIGRRYGKRAPKYEEGMPIPSTSRLDLAIVSTSMEGNPVLSGIDITLRYDKDFELERLEKYKKAFGNIPMADMKISKNLKNPSDPPLNYIRWY